MADADNPAASLPSSAASASEKVTSRDALQIKDRQQCLDRLRPAHVGRQDRRREPEAVGIGGVRLAVAHTRLADGNRTVPVITSRSGR
jgi:hypothetical protein